MLPYGNGSRMPIRAEFAACALPTGWLRALGGDHWQQVPASGLGYADRLVAVSRQVHRVVQWRQCPPRPVVHRESLAL